MHKLRITALIACSFLAFGAAALAQTESTPVPTQPKPDFSKFMTGTWSCSVMSSRRPGPYVVTTTSTVSPNGYWLLTRSVVHPTAWIPATIEGEDRMTYDPSTSTWIDMESDDQGGYDVSTSPGWQGDTIVWTDRVYPKSNNTATDNPTTTTKVSATKMVSTNSFTEPSGRMVHVRTTCTKS